MSPERTLRPDPLGQLWLWGLAGGFLLLAVFVPSLSGFFSLMASLLAIGGWIAHRGAVFRIEPDRLRARTGWFGAAWVVGRGEVESVGVERTPMQRRFGLGDVVLRLRDGRMLRLWDLRDPDQWAQWFKEHLGPLPDSPSPSAQAEEVLSPYLGTELLERMQVLVGLWAQGLLSEEEFQRERARLESPDRPSEDKP